MKLYLISKPCLVEENISLFLNDEKESWRQSEGAKPSEEIVELAGRICYMSFGEKQSPRSNLEYISNLIHQGHESVLEHPSWSFLVTGVTRAFTHQLVRHRVGFSFSQLSQQYHDEGHATFIPPIGVTRGTQLFSEWEKRVEQDRAAYNELLTSLLAGRKEEALDKEELRLIRSTARSVLPNCIETKMVFSANVRAIRHFLKLRGSIVGDLEMRYFSKELLLIMKSEAPNMFHDFAIEINDNDSHPIVMMLA